MAHHRAGPQVLHDVFLALCLRRGEMGPIGGVQESWSRPVTVASLIDGKIDTLWISSTRGRHLDHGARML